MARGPQQLQCRDFREKLRQSIRKSLSSHTSIVIVLRLQRKLTLKPFAKLLTVTYQALRQTSYHLSNLSGNCQNLQAHRYMVWASKCRIRLLHRHNSRQQEPIRDLRLRIIKKMINQYLRNPCSKASKKNQKVSLDLGKESHLVASKM